MSGFPIRKCPGEIGMMWIIRKSTKGSSQTKCPGETRRGVNHWEEHKGCRVEASLNFS